MVRDRLILGCKDKAARARLVREKECNLQRAVEALRISEATQEQLKSISGTEDQEDLVNAVNSSKKQVSSKYQNSVVKHPVHQQRKQTVCRYCGRMHPPDKLKFPAYGKVCRSCGKQNHFQSVCRQAQQQQPHTGQRLHAITDCLEEDSDDSAFYIEHVDTLHHREGKKFFVPLHIVDPVGNVTIECQLDTGATCNVISYNDVCAIMQHGNPTLAPTTARLKLYDGTVMLVLGECTLCCECKGVKHSLNFKVIAGSQKPLLSGETCNNLGLITINEVHQVSTPDSNGDTLIREYRDVFEGLGCLPGEYQIEIDSKVSPVQHAPRRAPVALKAKLKEKLHELESREIITRVDEPTAWISSLVTVLKPGKIRVCIDPRDLNKAIQRPTYQIHTLDEILPQLADARVFSVLDAKDGFHQVKLDERSSYLTTFWTPFGRYRYKRMPFGISSAPEEFQRRMHVIVQDLPRVEVIADDILVYGCGRVRRGVHEESR